MSPSSRTGIPMVSDGVAKCGRVRKNQGTAFATLFPFQRIGRRFRPPRLEGLGPALPRHRLQLRRQLLGMNERQRAGELPTHEGCCFSIRDLSALEKWEGGKSAGIPSCHDTLGKVRLMGRPDELRQALRPGLRSFRAAQGLTDLQRSPSAPARGPKD